MSLETFAAEPSRALFPALERLWRLPVQGVLLRSLVAVLATISGTYVLLCVKFVALQTFGYPFGDFYALWTSAVVAHDGAPLLNYDADALHEKQVALGMNSHGYNPFPYPPTLLLALAPLGGLPMPVAYAIWMIPAALAYGLAMTAGRWRDWRWLCGAALAPATGITIISGQTGFLSGALMLGGFRLAAARPVLAGVLFGLLAYKPQLGLLVPVALVAAGLWRSVLSAAATVALCGLVSSLVFGFAAWPTWLHALRDYADRFPPVFELMPTIEASLLRLGAPKLLAEFLQFATAAPVAAIVWSAFRRGVTRQGIALVLLGTFLATPHAFNYDMPMTTAAVLLYLCARYDAEASLQLGVTLIAALALACPFLILSLRFAPPFAFAILGLAFMMLARPWGPVVEWTTKRASKPAVDPEGHSCAQPASLSPLSS